MDRGRKKGVEDLEGLLGGLKLSEEERKAVRGARQAERREAGRPLQAVGKLFSSKSGYADGLVQTVGKIWCPREGIRCKELGNNLFLFTFLQPGGKRRAIMEGPWEFGGDLLIVVDFDGSKRLKELEFVSVPIWIRVFDLPLGLMNEETARRIGNKAGRFLEVDMDEDGLAVGEFLRIKVLLDIRKPLFRGVTMEGEGWCNIKYKFLPNFLLCVWSRGSCGKGV